ncbi:MAG: maleylpyruvate isomerase N-terminal domain-containing protein [Actinomycetota bacterium]
MTFDGRGQSSARVRELVVEAMEAAAALVADPVVGEAWEQPSALGGMTVGALSAHLVRAAGATLAYLDRTDPTMQPAGDLLTAVTYFHAAVDSPIHDRIKEVSRDEAVVGHGAIAEKANKLATDMAARLAAEPEDRLVAALGDRFLTLDDFCRTRLIEILLHLDDLAVSIGRERPATHPDGPAIVADILIGIARDNHGPWELLYALSRDERTAEAGVFPVF